MSAVCACFRVCSFAGRRGRRDPGGTDNPWFSNGTSLSPVSKTVPDQPVNPFHLSGDVDFFLLREQERNKSLLVSVWGSLPALARAPAPGILALGQSAAHTACEGASTPPGPRSLILLSYQCHHRRSWALVRGTPRECLSQSLSQCALTSAEPGIDAIPSRHPL